MCEIENEMGYVTATVIADGRHSTKQKQSCYFFERVFFAAIFVCVGWNSEKNRKGDLSYSSQLYYREADVFKNTNPLTLNTLNNNTY